MPEPLRIRCPSPAAVPPADELQRLATFVRHVVLHLPPESLGGAEAGSVRAAKGRLVEQLRPQLPDWSVFDSGGREGEECVTVLRVVTRSEVIEHADAIVSAAGQFRTTATELMARLASKLKVRPEDFHDVIGQRWMRPRRPRTALGRWLARRLSPDRGVGRLGRDCDYCFHGIECRFQRRQARRPHPQVVEVQLQFPGEFGVLDPWFFAKFVRSTPGLEGVARLFRSDFHDGCRMLEVLAEAGRLREVAVSHPFESAGWVVAPSGP